MARTPGWLRRFTLVVALAGLFGLLSPIPAMAHIAGAGASPSNYRTVVTGIRPAVPTLEVAVGVGGQWVRVTSHGAARIVVVGYRGEPFLRLSQNQVQVNELSSTGVETGLVRSQPASEDPVTEPRWILLRDGNSASWTDARIDAPKKSADDTAGASGSWQLPLVVDGQQVSVVGTRDLIPPPWPWPWVVALGVLTVAIAALGWLRNWHRPMAAVVAVGVLAFVLHLVGAGFVPQQNGPVFGWIGIGAVGAFTLLVGVVTVISTVRGSDAAPARLIMAGAVIVLLAATDISVLWYSQLPFAGPATLDRGLTALSYAAALGVLIAGVRLSRGPEPATAQPDTTESGRAGN